MPDEAATSKAEQGLTQRRAERRGEAISPAPGIDGREWVAIEEPLEIRAGGVALAITMRTPGDDAALAAGFLLAEGILISAQDIGAIETDATRFDERLRNGPFTSVDDLERVRGIGPATIDRLRPWASAVRLCCRSYRRSRRRPR